ncbi:hypothetical protein [Microcoleus sp. Pol12B5]|uniref:hypothetical protein n=1 Tax=Microcoleus sp. Pol12B5 TaxID=3055396 RepID=UPI002FD5B573
MLKRIYIDKFQEFFIFILQIVWQKNIRNNSYLADGLATFDNLLPKCDEAT